MPQKLSVTCSTAREFYASDVAAGFGRFIYTVFVLSFVMFSLPGSNADAQQQASSSSVVTDNSALPDAPDADAPKPNVPLRITSEVRVVASTDEIAQAQATLEEKQRVLGIIPNFYIAYAPHAAPLSSRQKFHLAWKSSTDPVAFMMSGAIAGIEQADNTFSGYGQGTGGYAKRFGANYADTFIGTMISSALLPSILKQDPRYFYQGTGTIRSRALHALASAVVSKGDNDRWQPSYSGILGGLAAGGISNLYYPAGSRNGLSLTFENALTGIASGAVQNLIQEFFVRKLTPKVPDYSPSK